MNDCQTRQEAWRYFQLHQWSLLRQFALRWCLLETQKHNEFWDWKRIHQTCDRFRCGAAFSFYSQHPHLYFA